MDIPRASNDLAHSRCSLSIPCDWISPQARRLRAAHPWGLETQHRPECFSAELSSLGKPPSPSSVWEATFISRGASGQRAAEPNGGRPDAMLTVSWKARRKEDGGTNPRRRAIHWGDPKWPPSLKTCRLLSSAGGPGTTREWENPPLFPVPSVPLSPKVLPTATALAMLAPQALQRRQAWGWGRGNAVGGKAADTARATAIQLSRGGGVSCPASHWTGLTRWPEVGHGKE